MNTGARRTASVLVPVAVGVAVGLSMTGVGLGFGASHRVCGPVELLGWSGGLVSPQAVIVPPPGGVVNYTDTLQAKQVSANGSNVTNVTVSSSSSVGYPINYTSADWSVWNWTVTGQISKVEPGTGTDEECPSFNLTPKAPYFQTAWSGYIVGPGAASGVGIRSITPSQLSTSPPSVVLNGSYPSSPAANFSWGVRSGVPWVSGVSNLSRIHATSTFWNTLGVGESLVLRVSVSEIDYGVPIHWVDGGTTILPARVPSALPSGTLTIEINYIFPVSDDQGTWSAYTAGGDSQYGLGGFVFERTA